MLHIDAASEAPTRLRTVDARDFVEGHTCCDAPAEVAEVGAPEGYEGHPKWEALATARKLEFLRASAAQTLSQVLHAEQGALTIASQLVSCAPTRDARLHAASQVFDEARHVELFREYLMERHGRIDAIHPNLRFLLDKVLSDDRWDVKFIGMQILVEGLALTALQTMRAATEEPRLRAIVGMIVRDVGRHEAHLVDCLADWIRALPQREIETRAEFAYEACVVMSNRLASTAVAEAFGFTRREAFEIQARSRGAATFRKSLFERIVPNLNRVGLLTDAIRPKFEALGVLRFKTPRRDGNIDRAALETPLSKRQAVA